MSRISLGLQYYYYACPGSTMKGTMISIVGITWLTLHTWCASREIVRSAWHWQWVGHCLSAVYAEQPRAVACRPVATGHDWLQQRGFPRIAIEIPSRSLHHFRRHASIGTAHERKRLVPWTATWSYAYWVTGLGSRAIARRADISNAYSLLAT